MPSPLCSQRCVPGCVRRHKIAAVAPKISLWSYSWIARLWGVLTAAPYKLGPQLHLKCFGGLSYKWDLLCGETKQGIRSSWKELVWVWGHCQQQFNPCIATSKKIQDITKRYHFRMFFHVFGTKEKFSGIPWLDAAPSYLPDFCSALRKTDTKQDTKDEEDADMETKKDEGSGSDSDDEKKERRLGNVGCQGCCLQPWDSYPMFHTSHFYCKSRYSDFSSPIVGSVVR